MMLTAFKGVALFVLSRHRFLIVAVAIVHLGAFAAFDHLGAAQRAALATYLLAAPFFLPLLLFTSAVNVATADLGRGESWYPRQLFTLPLGNGALALPFITYTVTLYALLFAAAAVILGDPVLGGGDAAEGQQRNVRQPLLDLALLASLQAAIWWPFAVRWLRIALLFALVAVYFAGLMLSIRAGVSTTALAALWVTLTAFAYALGARGIARARCSGESRPAPRSRAVPHARTDRAPFRSGLHAQRWFERRLQRRRGTVVAAFVVAFVLLTGAFLALIGAFTLPIGDPRPLALQFVSLFLWTLLIMSAATGPMFASFASQAHFADGNAFRMPPFLAALPFDTGDFAWAKLTAAAKRMALLALGMLAASAVVIALITFATPADPWRAAVTAAIEQRGAVRMTVAIGGTAAAFLALSGAATANLVWIGLFGRGWRAVSTALVLVVTVIIVAAPWLAAVPARRAAVIAALPDVFTALAAAKLAALAVLAYVVGARRLYSWIRICGIAAAWAAAVTLTAFVVLRYGPEGLIALRTLLATLIVLMPVLGIMGAPLALHVNRCR